MAGLLEQNGAVREPSEYAALTMERAITGLDTNRSFLRDAAVPYLQMKFYAASRIDSLTDGVNREINAKLDYARSPGSSVYNANLFPACNSFYSYKRIVNGVEQVRVLADGVDGVIYDATAGGKVAVFTKGSGAGKARFAGVNTALYFADGVENKKWLQPAPWQANTALATTQYEVGSYVLDNETPTPRLQYLGAAQVGTVTNVTLTAKAVNLAFSATNFNVLPGMTFKVTGLTGAAFLNGKLLIAQSVTGTAVVAFFDHVNYASTADTGTAVTTDAGTLATTGATQPTWATSYGATTADGLSIWTNFGNPLYNWTPQPPLTPPSLAPIGDSAATFWQPFTEFFTGQALLDENGFIQTCFSANTSGGALPQFNSPAVRIAFLSIGGNATSGIPPAAIATDGIILGTTTDGAITWYGSFWLGSFVANNVFTTPFAYNTYVIVVQKGPQPWMATALVANVGSGNSGGDVCVDSNGNLQMVTAWSGSGLAVTGGSAPTWNTNYLGTTADGSLTWKNLGPYLAIAFQGREYGYAYHAIDGSWSTLSPLSASTNGLLEGATVGGVYSTDLQVDSVGIFHTADGESTPLLLALIPNNTAGGSWTFNDEWNDEALDAEIPGPQAEANNPPPVGATAPLFHLDRLWMIYENGVIVSGGPDTVTGNGNTAFSPGSFFPIPEQPVRLFPTVTSQGPGLLIFGRANRWIILGQGTPSNPFQQAAQYGEGGGILSYDAVCKRGSTFYQFGDTALVGGNVVGKAVALDPATGETEFGFPIGDQFQNVTTGAGGKIPNAGVPLGYLYNPAETFVTYADLGSADTGIYVSDGAVGWFRCSPIASPESGFLWSPRRVIVGGTSAVQCIETQPGVQQLLIGPSGVVIGQCSVSGNQMYWVSGPQFNSGMVGQTVTLTTSTGSTEVPVSGFVSATQLTLGASLGSPFTAQFSIPENGPILFRDSTVNGDWYGGAYQAYPSYDVKGCIQLCLTGEVGEIAHVHLVSAAVGARPTVGLLFGEIAPTPAAPFAWYSRTDAEPPNLPQAIASTTVYSDRYTMLQNGVAPKCLFFQLAMDYGTQNFPDETLMFSVYGAKYAERRQQ
jgi:hypothetical protein